MAIIGPNGAGKSTLFKVISGIVKQDNGNVEFNNFNEDIINDAFSVFIKSIKENKIANFISFAISDNANIFNKILLKQGFKSINKKIFFIHKCNKKIDLNNILLFRSDIDTW